MMCHQKNNKGNIMSQATAHIASINRERFFMGIPPKWAARINGGNWYAKSDIAQVKG